MEIILIILVVFAAFGIIVGLGAQDSVMSAACLSFLLAVILTALVVGQHYKKQAVELGYGQYKVNSSGETSFTWITNEVKQIKEK